VSELLQSRYLLQVTRCRKLKPEGVELVVEIRPKPQAGQGPPGACGAANTTGKAQPDLSRE
jgi:hypothetical protein